MEEVFLRASVVNLAGTITESVDHVVEVDSVVELGGESSSQTVGSPFAMQ